MTDSKKYPYLRVFLFISLCPAFFGLIIAFYINILFIYDAHEKESFLMVLPMVIISFVLLSILFSSLMYSPPMIFLAIVIMAYGFEKIPVYLMLISALGGAVALGWCRLMVYLDGGSSPVYRDVLNYFHLPVMTDGIVFILGAVCSFVGAWFSLPKRVEYSDQ